MKSGASFSSGQFSLNLQLMTARWRSFCVSSPLLAVSHWVAYIPGIEHDCLSPDCGSSGVIKAGWSLLASNTIHDVPHSNLIQVRYFTPENKYVQKIKIFPSEHLGSRKFRQWTRSAKRRLPLMLNQSRLLPGRSSCLMQASKSKDELLYSSLYRWRCRRCMAYRRPTHPRDGQINARSNHRVGYRLSRK